MIGDEKFATILFYTFLHFQTFIVYFLWLGTKSNVLWNNCVDLWISVESLNSLD